MTKTLLKSRLKSNSRRTEYFLVMAKSWKWKQTKIIQALKKRRRFLQMLLKTGWAPQSIMKIISCYKDLRTNVCLTCPLTITCLTLLTGCWAHACTNGRRSTGSNLSITSSWKLFHLSRLRWPHPHKSRVSRLTKCSRMRIHWRPWQSRMSKTSRPYFQRNHWMTLLDRGWASWSTRI